MYELVIVQNKDTGEIRDIRLGISSGHSKEILNIDS